MLVQGMPNDEARATYQRADMIADQFLIGAYALFAIEGMALGKPVLCHLERAVCRAPPGMGGVPDREHNS